MTKEIHATSVGLFEEKSCYYLRVLLNIDCFIGTTIDLSIFPKLKQILSTKKDWTHVFDAYYIERGALYFLYDLIQLAHYSNELDCKK